MLWNWRGFATVYPAAIYPVIYPVMNPAVNPAVNPVMNFVVDRVSSCGHLCRIGGEHGLRRMHEQRLWSRKTLCAGFQYTPIALN
jgi:hypothetical protein